MIPPVTSAAVPTRAAVMAMALARWPLVSTAGSNTTPPCFDWALIFDALSRATLPSRIASRKPVAPTAPSDASTQKRPLPPPSPAAACGDDGDVATSGGGAFGEGAVPTGGGAVAGAPGGGGGGAVPGD